MSPDQPPAAVSDDPALAAAREARARQSLLAGTAPPPVLMPPSVHDPLSWCVATTVSLIAWVISPALAAAIFGILGLRAYGRAWRAGLRKSDCVLVDPRLVMLYLGLIALAGLAWTAWRIGTDLHLLGGAGS